MRKLACCCLLVGALWPLCAQAEVDQRPLDVKIVPAFPKIQWPDWVRGLDVGRPQDARPLLIMGTGDGTNRIFVGTEYGTVHVWSNDPNAVEMKTFVDLRDRVQWDEHQNEEGFLGLAFHPHFQQNGQFFVYYSAKSTAENPHVTVVSRFHVSHDDPNRGDPGSEEVLMRTSHPFWNHKGGTLVFGPDGDLYIAVGDGGSMNDPQGNGQNLKTRLGKILRIDVDHTDPGLPYAIPKDNRFVNRGGEALPEIWAYGLRNVWRMAFDHQTGVLWAGDVGQDLWEEIDLITRGGNFGWSVREAMHPFGPHGSPPRADLIEPIWEYNHSVGKSIIGGNVYRGKQVPALFGAYIYADYVTGQIWALTYDRDKKHVTANRTLRPKGQPILSFGQDDQGEVYFLTQDGGIFKFMSP